MKRIFVSDCEGPISKNDNAYELASKFILDGDKLFTNLSRYDDVLADFRLRSGYFAGGTLKLVLPFFKAFDVTDKMMDDFSAGNVVLIKDSKSTLQWAIRLADSFIVSTSYEHYIKALCNVTGFPFKNTYCTKLKLDNYKVTPKEKAQLKELAQEIAAMSTIEIPKDAKSPKDFAPKDQTILQRLDEIFWTTITSMGLGKILTEVNTVGGEQKAAAIRDIAKRNNASYPNIMYVGDSITDVEAFQLVRANGGLAVSFNGNSYAVKNAQIAVMSESNIVTAVIADLFFKNGVAKTLSILKQWSLTSLDRSGVDKTLLHECFTLTSAPKVQIVTTESMDSIIKASSEFRKKVRGVAVGRLG
jgi:energy-converting hydrogenase A subunit R